MRAPGGANPPGNRLLLCTLGGGRADKTVRIIIECDNHRIGQTANNF